MKTILRCAIYTRKSTEEGLDQAFNSLDAQREACEAYINSQKHEGWKIIPDKYDDGGFTGGNMERPALVRLLADIKAGKVNVVVVYKVDRLTRSLADFAKIVEQFDGQGVSFVSVTQQFNTTSSMGRLTLNVLLSFAQFEREVSGERIRDKIAASKRKGMWMGGNVPLGYQVEDRQLKIIPQEAETVRHIYKRYLELSCVNDLQQDLKRDGILSKATTTVAGKKKCGANFSRGALYHLLKNTLYIGQISHKGQMHQGQHEAIIALDLWNAVQKQLKDGTVARQTARTTKSGAVLAELLFDAEGNPLTPTHSNKAGKRYRYYISSYATKGKVTERKALRIPAEQLEQLIIERLKKHFADHEAHHAASLNFLNTDAQNLQNLLNQIVEKIAIQPKSITIKLKQARDDNDDEGSLPLIQTINIPYQYVVMGPRGNALVAEGAENSRINSQTQTFLKAIIRGHIWRDALFNTPNMTLTALARSEKMNEHYIASHINLAFLPPTQVTQIINGSNPFKVGLKELLANCPVDWQRTQS